MNLHWSNCWSCSHDTYCLGRLECLNQCIVYIIKDTKDLFIMLMLRNGYDTYLPTPVIGVGVGHA
jgi:hypothetical protein